MDPNDVSCRGRAGRPLYVIPSAERLLAYLGIRAEPVGPGAAAGVDIRDLARQLGCPRSSIGYGCS